MIRTRCYRDGAIADEGFPISDISDKIQQAGTVAWFDIVAPQRADLDVVRQELGLHDLAVDDALSRGQRPKIDHYPEHLFIVIHALSVGSGDEVAAHEVGIFVTKNAVVTVRADDGFDIDEVVKRWDNAPALAGSGVPFLLHGLLDYAVDTHYGVVQRLDNLIDSLEERVFDEATTDSDLQRRTFELRKSLVTLRRLALPTREVVNTLMRRDLTIIDAQLTPYFQDVYDHTLRVADQAESLRDLLANILETRLTVRGNRLNVVMKKVTSWAAIIAVPTAVTGFFGQNIPFPGSGELFGLWLSLGIMVASSVVLYLIFKARDWL